MSTVFNKCSEDDLLGPINFLNVSIPRSFEDLVLEEHRSVYKSLTISIHGRLKPVILLPSAANKMKGNPCDGPNHPRSYCVELSGVWNLRNLPYKLGVPRKDIAMMFDTITEI